MDMVMDMERCYKQYKAKEVFNDTIVLITEYTNL